MSGTQRISSGPASFEFAPERDGVTLWAWGRDNPIVRMEFSFTRGETAAFVELMCKNAGLPAPWTGQQP